MALCTLVLAAYGGLAQSRTRGHGARVFGLLPGPLKYSGISAGGSDGAPGNLRDDKEFPNGLRRPAPGDRCRPHDVLEDHNRVEHVDGPVVAQVSDDLLDRSRCNQSHRYLQRGNNVEHVYSTIGSQVTTHLS